MNINFTFKKFSSEDSDLWEEINNIALASSFLTSIPWIAFQKSTGKKTDQYFINLKTDEDEITVGLLYIEISRRKFSKIAYAPYGPVIDWEKLNKIFALSSNDLNVNSKFITDVYSSFILFFKKYIKEYDLNLFRFDPILPKEYRHLLLSVGYKTSLAPTQAKDTWVLNLEQDVEQIRSGMSKSTRYNINKGERSEIEIVKASNDEEIKAFSELMEETTGRKGFGNYNYEYFKKEFDALNHLGMCDIFLAKHKDKYLAGALINYYKDTASYTHGCSISNAELAKLRAPYSLQGYIINFAKEKGFKKYNFWGIIPEETIQKLNGRRLPLMGVSEFKKSFGGAEVSYTGAFEIGNDKIKHIQNQLYDLWVYRKDRY